MRDYARDAIVEEVERPPTPQFPRAPVGGVGVMEGVRGGEHGGGRDGGAYGFGFSKL